MAIASTDVEQVVAEISEGANDPNHVATVVGELMQRQPAIGHYVQGHATELTLEGTVMALLHAAVLVRCIEVDKGRRLPTLDFRALDRATRMPNALDEEPALASYVESNLADDDPLLGGKRKAVVRNLLGTVAQAALFAVR